MRVVIQRVKSSSVSVDNKIISQINEGLLILLGVAMTDEPTDAEYLADKAANLRIFEDDNGKMNRSLIDIAGEALVVSQFTLLGDCKKGRRPSYVKAAPPEKANKLYEYFIARATEHGIVTKSGVFQAMMDVSLINQGPVTLLLDTKEK